MKRLLVWSFLPIIIFSIYSCDIFGVDKKTLESIEKNVEMLQKAMVTVGDQFPGGLDTRMIRDLYVGNDKEKAMAKSYWSQRLNFTPEKPLRFQVTAKFENLNDTAGPVNVDLWFAPNISSVMLKKYIDQKHLWVHTINNVGNIKRPPHKVDVKKKVEKFIEEFIHTPTMFLLPNIEENDVRRSQFNPRKISDSFTEFNNELSNNVHISESCTRWLSYKAKWGNNRKAMSDKNLKRAKMDQHKINCEKEITDYYDNKRKLLVESIMTVVDMQVEIPSRKCDEIKEDWDGQPICYIFMPKEQLDTQPENFQIYISLHVEDSPEMTIGASKYSPYTVPMVDFRKSIPIKSSDSRWGGKLVHYEFNLGQVDLKYEEQLAYMGEVDKALESWRKKFAKNK